MNAERYAYLSDFNDGLTFNEIERGWHWCHDFDGLLVGPGMDELNLCTCDYHNVVIARATNVGEIDAAWPDALESENTK